MFALISASALAGVAQSVPPFASSAEYESMLTELARPAPRPSVLAAAGKQIMGTQAVVPVEETESSAGLRLETPSWKAEVATNPFAISFVNKVTGADWKVAGVDAQHSAITWTKPPRESGSGPALPLKSIQSLTKETGHWLLEGTPDGSSQPIQIEIRVASQNVLGILVKASGLGDEASSEFHIISRSALFGLGEQFAKASLAGFKVSLHPDDKPGTPGHLWDYMSIPFVYGPGGIGVYFDSALNCVFDSTATAQPGFSMRLGGPSVELYLIAAQDPKGVLKTYTDITGKPPLPPPWAFGVWHNSLQGRDAVLKDAADLRRAKIPVSALWVSDLMDQENNVGWPLWTFGYYGLPGSFTADLHKLGFKVLGYFYPYVRSLLLPYPLENPAFAEAVRNQYLVTSPEGKPVGPTFEPVLTGNVDFTNPRAVDWWQAKIERTLRQYDLDGWMEDFGEWIHDNNRFAAGKTGRTMATLNPLFWHKITYEIAHRIKPDVVEFARSGAPGSQAFTRVLWGGDQMPDWSPDNGLPSVVTAGITAGLSGFAVWGPDIVSAGHSKELFIRWTQFGALTPIMRDHLWDKPKFAVDLWFDDQTTDIFRRYARVHVSLFDYFYTLAHEALQTGVPIIRHPMLEFPDDPAAVAAEYEYLLGDRMLVAPVVKEGATTRQLYLPKGGWVNYWDGGILEGGKDVTVPAPLEEIPIFVPAGSVLPFTRSDLDTLAADLAGTSCQTLDNTLIWRVFPSKQRASSSFATYDGAKVSVEQDANRVVVDGKSPQVHQYKVVMNLQGPPREVVLSGRRLEKLADSGVRTSKSGWTFDSQTRTLQVTFLTDDFNLQVAV
jgi:alpha-glucosidase (family GH31 glycosyl hydrolase)